MNGKSLLKVSADSVKDQYIKTGNTRHSQSLWQRKKIPSAVSNFIAEGICHFEKDDIGHLFRGMVPFYVIKKMNQFIFFPAVVFPFFCQNTDKELTMEYCCGTYPYILCSF